MIGNRRLFPKVLCCKFKASSAYRRRKQVSYQAEVSGLGQAGKFLYFHIRASLYVYQICCSIFLNKIMKQARISLLGSLKQLCVLLCKFCEIIFVLLCCYLVEKLWICVRKKCFQIVHNTRSELLGKYTMNFTLNK